MLPSTSVDARTDLAGVSATTNRTAPSASGGPSFAGIMISTTGGSTDPRAADRTIAAAAGAAAEDVGILVKLAGAFRDGPPDGSLGVATIDRSGKVIADASLDANGNLSILGSGSFGAASSEVGMSLSAQDGTSWYASAFSELARASYELTALITQSTAAAGVDRAA